MTSQDVHLVVLIHGLWGRPSHLEAAKNELEHAWKRKHAEPTSGDSSSKLKHSGVPDEDEEDPVIETRVGGEDFDLVVMIAGGMAYKLTYDGIDVCASRVAWEVDQRIAELKTEGRTVSRFSVMGYSMGGLVARYLVGLLHSRMPSFFELHRPISFSTIATPHLGIPRYNTFLSMVLCWMGGQLMSRSGEQLYVVDEYSPEDPRPLLEIMADPTLSQFSSLKIFANAVKDDTVPYPSAAIEPIDHFVLWAEQGIEVEVNELDLLDSWRAPKITDSSIDYQGKLKKKRGIWLLTMGTLPPVLRFKFPLNYIILLLSPIMVPIIVLLMVARLSLDTNSSLACTSSFVTPASNTDNTSTPEPIPSEVGLSIEGLRAAIKCFERNLEQPLILAADSNEVHIQEVAAEHPQTATVKVRMTDAQLRMIYWLNKLPLQKHIAWFPEVANSHAVIIVRDPGHYPVHEKGRGVLRQWARGIVDAE